MKKLFFRNNHSDAVTPSLKGGYSMVEMLVYLALLTIITIAIVNAIVLMAQNYRNVKAYRSIESSAISAIGRMEREIRNATSVNGAQTTYNSSPGSLMLNTTDVNGTAITLRFYLSNSKVMMDRNGSSLGQLTSSDSIVSSLIFRSISTTTTSAVKIELTIQSGSTTSYVTKNFYDTAIMRGTY